ncbi:MAG: hypothetical protein ACNA7W_16360 [Pseudomonadales bacterium]
MYRITRIAYVWVLAAIASPAALAFDSRGYIERAVEYIEEGRHELARSYLDPALIDFRLSSWERSRAYYLRGYSYFAERMYVSANKDYNRALEFHPGNAAAMTAVAQMHMEGLGLSQIPSWERCCWSRLPTLATRRPCCAWGPPICEGWAPAAISMPPGPGCTKPRRPVSRGG